MNCASKPSGDITRVPPRDPAVLERVENLAKSYGSHQAVTDVSFGVEPGEVVALLGPNGAGKSTTLGMIAGLLVPDSSA